MSHSFGDRLWMNEDPDRITDKEIEDIFNKDGSIKDSWGKNEK